MATDIKLWILCVFVYFYLIILETKTHVAMFAAAKVKRVRLLQQPNFLLLTHLDKVALGPKFVFLGLRLRANLCKIRAKQSPKYKYLAWKAIEDIRKARKPKNQLDFKRQKLYSSV